MGDDDSIDRMVFLTYNKVATEWGINKKTLGEIIKEYQIEVHIQGEDLKYKTEGKNAYADGRLGNRKQYITRNGESIVPYIRRSVFKEFEQANPDLIRKLKDQSSSPILDGKRRKSVRHRESCRALAHHLWEQNPKQTIAGMARSCVINRIGCERNSCGDKSCKIKGIECDFDQHGNPYPLETLLGWIRDLNPNPNKGGGRPRKGD
jgi:hypothetical protein